MFIERNSKRFVLYRDNNIQKFPYKREILSMVTQKKNQVSNL